MVVGANGHGVTDRQTPGADLVDTALAELRKLHQPLHHRARKQHGVVGALLHFAIKALPTLRLTAPVPESSKNAPSGKLLQATRLLEESAQQNNSDARYILAEMNFYGNFSYPRNFSAAFDHYHQLALLNGNSSAMYMVGLMYSTGIGGAVERDQARALLYYTFAANKGHTRAEMTVAHRHHAGIGTP
jgi:SEL1 protein